jgi:predicted DNA-binding protein YlxM (UPF0122 family)
MNNYNIVLNIYEETLQKKIQNNKFKRYYNADLTLQNTANLIKQKRKRFSNGKGVKKFKHNTSDVNEKEDYVEQNSEQNNAKFNELFNFVADFTPQNLVVPETLHFDNITDDEITE